jgi:hypothetical protein
MDLDVKKVLQTEGVERLHIDHRDEENQEQGLDAGVNVMDEAGDVVC